MEHNEESGCKVLRKCRAELDSPATDWPISWSICRQPGVPPDLASFLWKMLLNLLPTQLRLQRMRISDTPACKYCREPGTLQHELLDCEHNMGVGQQLLTCLHQYLPSASTAHLLRLEIGELPEDKLLPFTILIAITLSHLWKQRTSSTRIRLYQIRAEIEQTINLLRTTRLSEESAKLEDLLNDMYP